MAVGYCDHLATGLSLKTESDQSMVHSAMLSLVRTKPRAHHGNSMNRQSGVDREKKIHMSMVLARGLCGCRTAKISADFKFLLAFQTAQKNEFSGTTKRRQKDMTANV